MVVGLEGRSRYAFHQHNQITSSARAFTRQRTQPHASVHARTTAPAQAHAETLDM